MRDIQISKRDNPAGITAFSILNISTASGISILVEKVTKAIFNKTKSNSFFETVGTDIYQVGAFSADPNSLAQLRTIISLGLRDIAKNIIQNTPAQAPQSEQLSQLTLVDLFFRTQSLKGFMQHILYMKVRLYPVAGGSEYLTFSVDDRAW